MDSSSTILITGGAGFIGSHLVGRLRTLGYGQLFVLDNYFTGSHDNHHEGVTYINGHTADISVRMPARPDVVFHLGEYARVEKSFDDMPLVWDSNIRGTFAVLEYCRKNGSKLIYAGSSTKFADGGMGRDQSPYAWTKAANTELVADYGVWFGLDYAITYFYNVYGGRELGEGPYATLIGIFKECSRTGKPLPVVAPGTQRRNFTHVEDIVDGLILVGARGHGDEYGIGAPQSYSVKEVAELFGGPIEWLPERKGNRMDALLDTRRTTHELGWAPRHTLPAYIAGLKNT